MEEYTIDTVKEMIESFVDKGLMTKEQAGCIYYKDIISFTKTELEKGDLNLDESISKFEEGIKISKECNKILEEAEKKITILLEKDGELKEENFETEE